MKKIKVGLDFDGVVAYNPFRIIRAPVTWFKREVLGVKRLRFFVPSTPLERFFWIVVHESSVFPANGTKLLRELSKRPDMEFHLITARFHFLQPSLTRWLRRYGMESIFTSVNMNMHDLQPHEHKLDVIERLKLDYFVEDNWDIVEYVQPRTSAVVYWNYNVTDRRIDYPHKIPYLKKALAEIEQATQNS